MQHWCPEHGICRGESPIRYDDDLAFLLRCMFERKRLEEKRGKAVLGAEARTARWLKIRRRGKT